MDKKEAFIKIVDFLFEDYNEMLAEGFDCYEDAKEFYAKFKEGKVRNSGAMTENGRKVLEWMQLHEDEMTNIFTSKEIAEALFTSGRSVSGSMRKLFNDGLVTKSGKDPVQYSLTVAGREYQFEN